MSELLKKLDYSILQQCMHCGMCLPSCPTYALTKIERHSPRGRIALMRAVADDRLAVSHEFGEEMSYCLGCLACETACPAGVDYTHLLETARAEIEQTGVMKAPSRNWVRSFALGFLFTRPGFFRDFARWLGFYQRSGLQSLVRKTGLTHLLPVRLQNLERQTPTIQAQFSHELIQPWEQPKQIRYRVGLLTGCVQDVVFPGINRDTATVLLRHGCAVATPSTQYCCGSLHAHNGEPKLARALARQNLDTFDLDNLDAIITNSAGCGSHLKHYDQLLHDDAPYAEKAKQWSRKVRDIHEWLIEIGLEIPKELSPEVQPQRVTYHEACHLCHGQKITQQPRFILASIPGLELVELPESTWCCGSAGIYNITQPETSAELLDRKVRHILSTGAWVVATANPGCLLQIRNGLQVADRAIRVAHPITLLAEAYTAERQTG